MPAAIPFAPRDLGLAPPLAEDAARRRTVPAWLMSFCLHLTILTFAVLVFPRGQGGIRSEPERSGGIALVQREGDERRYVHERSDAGESAPPQASPPQNIAAALPSEGELPVDVNSLLPGGAAAAFSPADLGGVLPSADDLLGGVDLDVSVGGAARTGVFGVVGTGSKFVYVFDRSGSMDGYGGRPLAAAKAELTKSLADLGRVHQFQVIFYNERPAVFHHPGEPPEMIWADEKGKSEVAAFISGILAAGGTRHLEPLKMAITMRPDVIFFLTDADEPRLSERELAELDRLNRNVGASINTIEFGYGDAQGRDNFLVELARRHNGQYVYVNVSQLRSRP